MAEEIEFVIEGYITKVEDNDPNVNAMLNEYFSIGDLMTGIISYETDTPRDEWNSRVDQNFYWLGYSPDFWPSFGEMKFVINGVTFDQDPKRCTDPDPPLCRASYEACLSG